MNIEFKSLADLEKIDGGLVARAFEKELRGIFDDLRERPALAKAREIIVKLTFVPATDASGTELVEVKMTAEIAPKRPASKCRELSTRLLGVEKLVYDDLSPNDVHQRTIDGELERKKAHGA